MDYDPELPDGFQSADFEQRDLERCGNIASKLRKQGICMHGWLMAPPNKPAVCNHCGKEFASAEDAYAEHDRLKREYF